MQHERRGKDMPQGRLSKLSQAIKGSLYRSVKRKSGELGIKVDGSMEEGLFSLEIKEGKQRRWLRPSIWRKDGVTSGSTLEYNASGLFYLNVISEGPWTIKVQTQ